MRLRVVCPPDLRDTVLDILRADAGATHLVLFAGAAREPEGDVVEADVAREAVDALVVALAAAGCRRDGAIVLEQLDTVLSDRAVAAERAAPGEGADAVVWEELIDRTEQDSRPTVSFVVLLTIACLLAAVGVVTNSPVTVVGAMVLGPEYGPLAALAVAVVRRDAALARSAAAALVVGFGIAALVTAAATALAQRVDLVPGDALVDLDQVAFVYQVGPFSFIVAILAGIAGLTALTSGGRSALVGVFISVTTVPAVGFAAVAAVLGDLPGTVSSLLQLAVNMIGIVLAGVAVLLLDRARRRRGGRTAAA